MKIYRTFSSPGAALLLVSNNATSGKVQHLHGLPITLRMLEVKYDKYVWFRLSEVSILFVAEIVV